MKRHNAKIANKVKSTNSPAHSAFKGQSHSTSPEVSHSRKGGVLYVDVVKNLPKQDIPLPSPPPPPISPEFSIFREDFPALPGSTIPSVSSSNVPDDWTAMLSEDDDDQEEEEEGSSGEVPASDVTPVSVSSEDDFELQHVAQAQAQGQSSCDPDILNCLTNTTGLDVGLIFCKQFLLEGVRQRALCPPAPFPEPRISAPPGFENARLYARLKARNMGLPVGGVEFELMPGNYAELWKQQVKPGITSVGGSFGLLGLANNLGSIPFKTEPHMDTGTNCCSAGNSQLHSIFTGPLYPEITYNVPRCYMMFGVLGLPQPNTVQMEVELLFYYFYTYPADMMQMLSAAELAERGWRFHKIEHVWIKRQTDNPNYLCRGSYESGEYNYFNMFQWKIFPRHFNLEPEQLERTITKMELFERHGYHPQMGNL
ncbi:hypothetical protein KR009_005804 [Drosophila setifemur]|nr:hypothetical protein KR009_005804 [Drosophila setifemur]